MIDLTSIKSYIIDASEYCIKEASKVINNKGFLNWFNNQTAKFLNCSHLSKEGHRLVQTNFISYKEEISITILMIEQFGGDNKDYYYEELLKLHNNNLEFEDINGFEYNGRFTNKKKSTRTRNKQTSLEYGNKPKKETAAERKLKSHVAKISGLSIKLKPIKHDNSL